MQEKKDWCIRVTVLGTVDYEVENATREEALEIAKTVASSEADLEDTIADDRFQVTKASGMFDLIEEE